MEYFKLSKNWVESEVQIIKKIQNIKTYLDQIISSALPDIAAEWFLLAL